MVRKSKTDRWSRLEKAVCVSLTQIGEPGNSQRLNVHFHPGGFFSLLPTAMGVDDLLLSAPNMTNYRGWMTVFLRNARVHRLVRPRAGQRTSALETDVLIDRSQSETGIHRLVFLGPET